MTTSSVWLRTVLCLCLGVGGGSGCAANRTGVPAMGAGEAAAAAVVLGVTASAVSRSQGGCYAACPTGTTCDPSTGYCVRLPCGGRCSADEFCDEGKGGVTAEERCVRVAQPMMEISGDSRAPVAGPVGDAPVKETVAQPAGP